jgi:plastocyanin
MGLRRASFLLICALLACAVAVLPAVAGSETSPSTVTAVNTEGLYKGHYWSPSTVTVGAGGVVAFSNPSSEVKHGLEWTGGPATPSCRGVPGGLGATAWHGECTLAQVGTYTFRCTVHPTEMTGSITVDAAGTTTTVNQAPPAGAPSGGTTTTGTPATPGEQLSQTTAGSPLAGSASQALRMPAGQRGRSVLGSLRVSQAGAGGRLEVDLLARRASLAGATHGAPVRVGRLLRSAIAPGKLSFKVALNSRAARTLRLRRRLALTVRILLSAPHGAPVSITRGVVLHA